jgi:hypothetical protein
MLEPVTASVRVRRPRAAVHELLSDLERRPLFLDHFLVEWAFEGQTRGAGAVARLRAKGGGGDDRIEIVVEQQTPERIVEHARSGRRMRRRWRLTYALEEVSEQATQVSFTLELLEGSRLDRATWRVTRGHLERQYAQAMLRLKGVLEGDPRGS